MNWCYRCNDFCEADFRDESQYHSEVRAWENIDIPVCSNCGSEDIVECSECERCGHPLNPDEFLLCTGCQEVVFDAIQNAIKEVQGNYILSHEEAKKIIAERLDDDY